MARQKKPEEVAEGSPAWMSTYGDLVTLLMCFFVMLFAMSSIDAVKFDQLAASMNTSYSPTLLDSQATSLMQAMGNGIIALPIPPSSSSEENVEQEEDNKDPRKEASDKELNDMSVELKTYFAEEMKTAGIEVEVRDNFVLIEIPGGLMFESARADLTAAAEEVMLIIGEALSQYTENDIWIEGHTDDFPMLNTAIFKNNMYLSQARAMAVWEFLVDNEYVDFHRLVAIGHGERAPVATNDTPEGRAQNRRVEIKVRSSQFSTGNQ